MSSGTIDSLTKFIEAITTLVNAVGVLPLIGIGVFVLLVALVVGEMRRKARDLDHNRTIGEYEKMVARIASENTEYRRFFFLKMGNMTEDQVEHIFEDVAARRGIPFPPADARSKKEE